MAVQVICNSGTIYVEDTSSGQVTTLNDPLQQTPAGWASVVVATQDSECILKTSDGQNAAKVTGPAQQGGDTTVSVYPNSDLGPRQHYYGSYRRVLTTPTGNVGIRG